MKGYKAFNKDLTCRGMQYEVGKTYEMDDSPIICGRGFHFCKSLADCYQFYETDEDTRICEVKAIGEVVTDDEVKYCTNKIVVVKEVENPRAKSNRTASNSGYCNSGNWNSGNRNSGDWNSGNRNSGARNSGNWNSGNRNSGNWNSGNRNSGAWNSGNWNSGARNSGDSNSGNRNNGDWNSGNRNSGDWNSGDWNSGNWNSGVFCTSKNPTIKLFDKDSNWTITDWVSSEAYDVMRECPYTYYNFINTSDMTEEEKERYPEYKITGGYIKTIIATKELKQEWWDGLPEGSKMAVMSLPNFDSKKFEKCTGIKVERSSK